MDIALRSRGAIFMLTILNLSSVYLRVLWVSMVILQQAQDDNRQARDDSNELERIADGKTENKIIFSPMSITQFYLVDDPWILQPWFTQGESYIKTYYKHRYVESKTKTGING